ncbi:MAG: 50S ribosomal protein L23 [bacterium]
MSSLLGKILKRKETEGTKPIEKMPAKKQVLSREKSEKLTVAGIKKQLVKQIITKSAHQAYEIIKGPHITEKSTVLAEQNKYVFRITSRANKIEIKKAIKALYGVKTESVHIIHSAPKKRRLGRSQGWSKGLKHGYKKAIITLKQGEKIEVLPR